MNYTRDNDDIEEDKAERSVRGRIGGKPNPIDVHVGSRLRLRRTLLGLSQQKVGDALGLTFQQVQKYERGANRIGASRLWDLSGVLDCPVSFFFEEMDSSAANQQKKSDLPPNADIGDPMNRRETLDLVRAYYRITEEPVRRRIYELTKSLGAADMPSMKPEMDEAMEEDKDETPKPQM
jgi:transcriptional regulator with XRE-family HTH domain